MIKYMHKNAIENFDADVKRPSFSRKKLPRISKSELGQFFLLHYGFL